MDKDYKINILAISKKMMYGLGKDKKYQRELSLELKQKYERKLRIAKETPEPIFDLSDCQLKSLPENIFILCKIYRKEALYLQNNQLTKLDSGGPMNDLHLLKIIDLSSNKFSSITPDIGSLSNVEVLDLSKNQLTTLPPKIGLLGHLVWLNVSFNDIVSLPDELGNCYSLEVIDLSNNPNLKRLPVTFGKLQYLFEMDISDTAIEYPPVEICERGVKNILAFLAKEMETLNISFTTPRISTKIEQDPAFFALQEKIRKHEMLKDEKQRERLSDERKFRQDTLREVGLRESTKSDKKKLLEEVKQEQDNLDANISRIQEKKNLDRAALIKFCILEEEKSNELVSQILNNTRKAKKTSYALWEADRKLEEQKLLERAVKTKEIEKKLIISSMNDTMKEELTRIDNETKDKRYKANKTLAMEITQKNEALQVALEKRDQTYAQLLEKIRQDEEYQKYALATLLEKSDTASWELSKQILLVEEQLLALTKLEISQRRVKAEEQIAELNKNRNGLTKLLMDLFARQQERRKQLAETIRKLETLREVNRKTEFFWLEQYDQLLNSTCQEMVKFLDSIHKNLLQHFFFQGVFHYIPLLKNHIETKEDLARVNMTMLNTLPIKSMSEKSAILRAIELHLSETYPKEFVASTPPVASSTKISSHSKIKEDVKSYFDVPDDCVICLDLPPTIVFIPCGHVCTCVNCFSTINSCPLCRKQIVEIHPASLKVFTCAKEESSTKTENPSSEEKRRQKSSKRRFKKGSSSSG